MSENLMQPSGRDLVFVDQPSESVASTYLVSLLGLTIARKRICQ